MTAANELIVLWTSRDPEVALNMAFMHAYKSLARGWWGKGT